MRELIHGFHDAFTGEQPQSIHFECIEAKKHRPFAPQQRLPLDVGA
jgi:hypothetical protein